MQFLELAPGQGWFLGLQFAQCRIYAGDGVGGQGVLVVLQFQAGAQGPVAAPLFFALDAKLRTIIDGRNAPKGIY